MKLPSMMTDVPPRTGPVMGLRRTAVGTRSYVKFTSEAVRNCWPLRERKTRWRPAEVGGVRHSRVPSSPRLALTTRAVPSASEALKSSQGGGGEEEGSAPEDDSSPEYSSPEELSPEELSPRGATNAEAADGASGAGRNAHSRREPGA